MLRITAIDHDTDYLTPLSEMLGAHLIENLCYTDASVDRVADARPDVVMLVVSKGGPKAYELCKTLKNDPATTDIPVIFISSNDSVEHKIRCFNAGAQDFISKPVNPELLEVKLRLLQYTYQTLRNIKLDHQSAQLAAMEAMLSSSEQGRVLQFVERCQLVETEEDLASEVLKVCREFDLNIVVGIKREHIWIFRSTTGLASPIEQEIVESLYDQGRFVDFSQRTQVNYPNISVLVKNMPLDANERYGRMKDILPSVLSTANVRLHSIWEAQAVLQQTQLMTRSIETVQPSLSSISAGLDRLTQENQRHLSQLLQNMAVKLTSMGLDDDQEEYILSNLEAAAQYAEALATEGGGIRSRLSTVNTVLDNLLSRQRQIAEIVNRKLEMKADETVELGDIDDDGVELF